MFECNYVYWLKLPHHNDWQTQGYIGVSKDPKERFRHHLKNSIGDYHSDKVLSKAIKKYGKNLIQQQIMLCSTKEICYSIEKKMRPKAFIGWNMREGGYHTPNPFPVGSKKPKYISEKVAKILGDKRKAGESIGRDRKVQINDIVYPSIKAAREAHNISKTQMKRFLDGFEYKHKKSNNTKFSHLKISYV
jgi:hypothetical protein